jgi:hypothetical protein
MVRFADSQSVSSGNLYALTVNGNEYSARVGENASLFITGSGSDSLTVAAWKDAGSTYGTSTLSSGATRTLDLNPASPATPINVTSGTRFILKVGTQTAVVEAGGSVTSRSTLASALVLALPSITNIVVSASGDTITFSGSGAQAAQISFTVQQRASGLDSVRETPTTDGGRQLQLSGLEAVNGAEYSLKIGSAAPVSFTSTGTSLASIASGLASAVNAVPSTTVNAKAIGATVTASWTSVAPLMNSLIEAGEALYSGTARPVNLTGARMNIADVLSVSINRGAATDTVSYTIADGDTPESVAGKLATGLNGHLSSMGTTVISASNASADRTIDMSNLVPLAGAVYSVQIGAQTFRHVAVGASLSDIAEGLKLKIDADTVLGATRVGNVITLTGGDSRTATVSTIATPYSARAVDAVVWVMTGAEDDTISLSRASGGTTTALSDSRVVQLTVPSPDPNEGYTVTVGTTTAHYGVVVSAADSGTANRTVDFNRVTVAANAVFELVVGSVTFSPAASSTRTTPAQLAEAFAATINATTGWTASAASGVLTISGSPANAARTDAISYGSGGSENTAAVANALASQLSAYGAVASNGSIWLTTGVSALAISSNIPGTQILRAVESAELASRRFTLEAEQPNTRFTVSAATVSSLSALTSAGLTPETAAGVSTAQRSILPMRMSMHQRATPLSLIRRLTASVTALIITSTFRVRRLSPSNSVFKTNVDSRLALPAFKTGLLVSGFPRQA